MLDDLRKEIDLIDSEIVNLIAKRIEVVKKVGQFKKENNIPVIDNSRFKKVLNKVGELAEKNKISKDFVKDIYNKIHEYMCSIEKDI